MTLRGMISYNHMFVPLGPLVSQALARRGLQDRISSTQTLMQFRILCEKIWGDNSRTLIKACRIEQDGIVVQVCSASFASELQTQEYRLLKELNTHHVRPLRKLRVRVG